MDASHPRSRSRAHPVGAAMSAKARVKELLREWDALRFGLSEREAAEAWAESMALHEAGCPALNPPKARTVVVVVAELVAPHPDDDFVSRAQRYREEHEATHCEAEMCGGPCIVLGLVGDDEELTPVPDTALDVDRLAHALVVAVRSERAPIGGRGDGWPAYWEKGIPATVLNVDRLAAAIAREYAALGTGR